MATPAPPAAIPSEVLEWHRENACCLHNGEPVTDRACCVCDAEAPCEEALEEARLWHPWALCPVCGPHQSCDACKAA